MPDVAFVARALLLGRTSEELESADLAPTVAVEVLSPGDASIDVAHEVDVYLRSGCELVVIADPSRRTLALHDPAGSGERAGSDVLRHPVWPHSNDGSIRSSHPLSTTD